MLRGYDSSCLLWRLQVQSVFVVHYIEPLAVEKKNALPPEPQKVFKKSHSFASSIQALFRKNTLFCGATDMSDKPATAAPS